MTDYFAHDRGAEYRDDHVCLSVVEHISGTTCPTVNTIFIHVYLCPGLVAILAGLRYVMYFRFYG